MPDLIIELDRKDLEFHEPQLAELGDEATRVEATRFDGVLLLQVLVTLGAASIVPITKIIQEAIKANRYVVVKRNGAEVRGLSADNAIKVLKALEDD